MTTIGLFTAGAGGLVYALEQSIDAEVQAHPVPLPWYHKGPLRSFDHARYVSFINYAIFQVY